MTMLADVVVVMGWCRCVGGWVMVVVLVAVSWNLLWREIRGSMADN